MKEWLPDWTDTANYPDSETTSMGEWAWEFLRRNPSYQADYKNLLDEWNRIGFYEACEPPHPGIINGTPKSLDEENDIIEQGEQIYYKLIPKYKVERFLHGPPNPALPYKEELPLFQVGSKLAFYNFFNKSKVTSKYSTYILGGLPEGRFHRLIEKGMNKEACMVNKSRNVQCFKANSRSLTVQISLDRPLLEQLKMIKEVATAQQKQLAEWGILKKSRKETERYIGYLQLLDALEAGAEKQKILDILFPNLPNEYPDQVANKNFNNWKSVAEKLRDFDYLKIAALHYPAGA